MQWVTMSLGIVEEGKQCRLVMVILETIGSHHQGKERCRSLGRSRVLGLLLLSLAGRRTPGPVSCCPRFHLFSEVREHKCNLALVIGEC